MITVEIALEVSYKLINYISYNISYPHSLASLISDKSTCTSILYHMHVKQIFFVMHFNFTFHVQFSTRLRRNGTCSSLQMKQNDLMAFLSA